MIALSDRCARRRAACGNGAADLIVAAGHSAGGHLAACLLATDWSLIDPTLPKQLASAAFAISGLFDLEPLVPTSINRALKLTPLEARRLSPLHWKVNAGTVLDTVVGGAESYEYHRQSEAIVERWAAQGVATRYESVPDANHFTVIAPLADPGLFHGRALGGTRRVIL